MFKKKSAKSTLQFRILQDKINVAVKKTWGKCMLQFKNSYQPQSQRKSQRCKEDEAGAQDQARGRGQRRGQGHQSWPDPCPLCWLDGWRWASRREQHGCHGYWWWGRLRVAWPSRFLCRETFLLLRRLCGTRETLTNPLHRSLWWVSAAL